MRKDSITINVPPHQFDGMRHMTFSIEVDDDDKHVNVLFCEDFGTYIMKDILEKVNENYIGYTVSMS